MNDRLHRSRLLSKTHKGFDQLRVHSRTNLRTMFGRVVLFAGVMFVFALGQSTTAKAGVTLSSAPTTRTVNAGQSATYTININRDNYTGSVTLSASNLPAGAAASFTPNPTTTNSSNLTLTTRTTTPTGTFQIKVTGIASGISIAPINVTLIVRPASSVALSTLPSTLSIIAGQNATVDVHIARQNYDGPVYLSAANVPEGVTVAFEENPANGPKSTMRIYSHGLPHVWKDFVVTIRGESSAGVVTNAQLRLVVSCGIEWVQQFGTAQHDVYLSGTRDTYQSVAVDGSGNIYVASDTFVSGKGSEIWVAKYNNAGQQLWFTPPFGTPGEKDDRVLAIAVDSAGNIFLGGYTNGLFAGNANQGGYDFWIAKYDGTGNQPVLAWVKQDGGQVEDGANGFEIVPDGTGGGKFTTFINDRRLIATYSFTTNGSLSPEGVFPELPSVFRNSPWDLALGPADTVVVAGSLAIEEGDEVIRAWVRKYDLLTGALLFDDDIPSQGFRRATRVVVDGGGKIYVTGTIWDFDVSCDAWVRIYDPAQSYAHVETTIGSDTEDFINALAIDGNGDLIVAGKTLGVLGESNGNTPGKEDAWVARLHGVTADLVWIRQFPVAGDDSFQAAAIDANGGVVLAGYTATFKAWTGSQDALLMRYQASSTTRFPPFISRFSNPVTGQSITSAAVGNTIRIHGGNFGLFSTPPVRFNGTPTTSTRIGATALDAVVPAGARNTTGYVTVTSDCECVRSPTQFTVLP